MSHKRAQVHSPVECQECVLQIYLQIEDKRLCEGWVHVGMSQYGKRIYENCRHFIILSLGKFDNLKVCLDLLGFLFRKWAYKLPGR